MGSSNLGLLGPVLHVGYTKSFIRSTFSNVALFSTRKPTGWGDPLMVSNDGSLPFYGQAACLVQTNKKLTLAWFPKKIRLLQLVGQTNLRNTKSHQVLDSGAGWRLETQTLLWWIKVHKGTHWPTKYLTHRVSRDSPSHGQHWWKVTA